MKISLVMIQYHRALFLTKLCLFTITFYCNLTFYFEIIIDLQVSLKNSREKSHILFISFSLGNILKNLKYNITIKTLTDTEHFYQQKYLLCCLLKPLPLPSSQRCLHHPWQTLICFAFL